MKSWSIAAALLLGCVVGTSSAGAQTIYEPVRYQYGGSTKYYYGGTDPRVHQLAAWNAYCSRYYDVTSQHQDVGFTASRGSRLPRVYNDCMPEVNAAWFGYGVSAARNSAYANAPRNFTKRQLKQNAIVINGVRVVPGKGPLAPEIRDASAAVDSGPAIRPIMIIPKQALPKPAPAAKLVAAR